MLKEPYSKNPDEISKEIDLSIKLKDIEQMYNIKDTVAFKWWETFLVLMLFITGAGFLMTMLKAEEFFPPERKMAVRFIIVWLTSFIVIVIATVEFLIMKFRALRKLYEMQTRNLTSLIKDIEDIRKSTQQKSVEDNKN